MGKDGIADVNSQFCSIAQELKPTISYLPPEELELVHDALKVKINVFVYCLSVIYSEISVIVDELLSDKLWLVQVAYEAHDGQKRRSGEPFIVHPVEVARILGELVSNAKIINILLSEDMAVFGI